MLMTKFSDTSIFIEGISNGRPVKVSTENKAILTGIDTLKSPVEIMHVSVCVRMVNTV